jgi:HSP20 family molecular chaperone IbpA
MNNTDQQSPDQSQNANQGQLQGQAQSQGTGQQVNVKGQDASGTAMQRTGKSNVGVLMPPVDVVEDPTGITLIADMPGVSKDTLNLRLDANSLTIEGALSLDTPDDMQSRYAEVRHQHYERTFALSKDLDGNQATAELANGVLKVRIPKTQEAAPRKIPVNVA